MPRVSYGQGASAGLAPWVPALAALWALATPSCHAQFTGPYACDPGYASCVDPQASSCETNITSDAINCGGCAANDGGGSTCSLGAPCVGGSCGAGAVELTANASLGQAPVAANATTAFWSDSAGGITAEALTPGSTPMVVTSGMISSCGQAATFTVDDNFIYWLSQGYNCGQVNNCQGLVEAPIHGLTPMILAAPPSSTGNAWCGSLALSPDGQTIYVLYSENGGFILASGPTQAGLATLSILTTISGQTNNGGQPGRLVVTSSAAIFSVQGANDQAELEVVPTSGGGSPMTVPLPGDFTDFAADESYVYVVSSYCPCDNNNSGGFAQQVSQVTRTPISGGSSKTLSSSTGQAGRLALDSQAGTLYWTTESTLWKAPVVGGAAVAVAGNLSLGATTNDSDNCCMGNSGVSSYTVDMALATDHAVLGDRSPTVNAVLEVGR
jgi:hypothetical protein